MHARERAREREIHFTPFPHSPLTITAKVKRRLGFTAARFVCNEKRKRKKQGKTDETDAETREFLHRISLYFIRDANVTYIVFSSRWRSPRSTSTSTTVKIYRDVTRACRSNRKESASREEKVIRDAPRWVIRIMTFHVLTYNDKARYETTMRNCVDAEDVRRYYIYSLNFMKWNFDSEIKVTIESLRN